MDSILNTLERLFSTFDGVCHQTFRAARFDVLRTVESDSDDEEEYVIKRNKFGAPIYGPETLLPYSKTVTRTHDNEAGSSRSKRPRQHKTMEELFLTIGCDEEIDDMLRIRLREAGSDEEIFTSVAWIRDFNINEPIYAELCREFYSTY
ncbi:hypothetical protein Tco_0963276 [Tanacetum coccineum]